MQLHQLWLHCILGRGRGRATRRQTRGKLKPSGHLCVSCTYAYYGTGVCLGQDCKDRISHMQLPLGPPFLSCHAPVRPQNPVPILPLPLQGPPSPPNSTSVQPYLAFSQSLWLFPPVLCHVLCFCHGWVFCVNRLQDSLTQKACQIDLIAADPDRGIGLVYVSKKTASQEALWIGF